MKNVLLLAVVAAVVAVAPSTSALLSAMACALVVVDAAGLLVLVRRFGLDRTTLTRLFARKGGGSLRRLKGFAATSLLLMAATVLQAALSRSPLVAASLFLSVDDQADLALAYRIAEAVSFFGVSVVAYSTPGFLAGMGKGYVFHPAVVGYAIVVLLCGLASLPFVVDIFALMFGEVGNGNSGFYAIAIVCGLGMNTVFGHSVVAAVAGGRYVALATCAGGAFVIFVGSLLMGSVSAWRVVSHWCAAGLLLHISLYLFMRRTSPRGVRHVGDSNAV